MGDVVPFRQKPKVPAIGRRTDYSNVLKDVKELVEGVKSGKLRTAIIMTTSDVDHDPVGYKISFPIMRDELSNIEMDCFLHLADQLEDLVAAYTPTI